MIHDLHSNCLLAACRKLRWSLENNRPDTQIISDVIFAVNLRARDVSSKKRKLIVEPWSSASGEPIENCVKQYRTDHEKLEDYQSLRENCVKFLADCILNNRHFGDDKKLNCWIYAEELMDYIEHPIAGYGIGGSKRMKYKTPEWIYSATFRRFRHRLMQHIKENRWEL